MSAKLRSDPVSLKLYIIINVKVRSAYRMDQPTHIGGNHSCRRNCRANPSCLVGLGERVWLEAEEEEEESDGEEGDELVRLEGVPAGLRNLGNTCYVNSFLQIWFHNLRFRQVNCLNMTDPKFLLCLIKRQHMPGSRQKILLKRTMRPFLRYHPKLVN